MPPPAGARHLWIAASGRQQHLQWDVHPMPAGFVMVAVAVQWLLQWLWGGWMISASQTCIAWHAGCGQGWLRAGDHWEGCCHRPWHCIVPDVAANQCHDAMDVGDGFYRVYRVC